MPPDNNGLRSLEDYRQYLLLLSRAHVDGALRQKLDASDIVQETLLQAHQAWPEFRGRTAEQQAAWLRKILANTIARAGRDLRRAKRDMGRERSLEAALARSSAGLGACLAADQPSPSENALRQERILQVADAVATLPASQREAIAHRYMSGLNLADIGAKMERTPNAVGLLLHEGMKRLRALLDHPRAE